MASTEQVRDFLAHWFQLGKPVVMGISGEEYLPSPVFADNRYSSAFEACWQQIISRGGENCYLKGTDQTIATMLTPAWEIVSCSRCTMPIVIRTAGTTTSACPCGDLLTWPNLDVPTPRSAMAGQEKLDFIRERLNLVKAQAESSKRQTYEPDDTRVFASWRGMS